MTVFDGRQRHQCNVAALECELTSEIVALHVDGSVEARGIVEGEG